MLQRRATRRAWSGSRTRSRPTWASTSQLDPVEPKAYTALTKDPATTPQVFFLGWCQDYPDPQDWLSLVFRSDSTVTHVAGRTTSSTT